MIKYLRESSEYRMRFADSRAAAWDSDDLIEPVRKDFNLAEA